MLYDLPTGMPSPSRNSDSNNNSNNSSNNWTNDLTRNRYAADTDTQDRSTNVTLYGSPLRVTPPILVHGAMLSYFARLERRSVYDAIEQISVGRDVSHLPHSSHLTMGLADLKDSRVYDADFYRCLSFPWRLACVCASLLINILVC